MNLTTLPNRILSPEEFSQAQGMAPAAISADAFPATPPDPTKRKPLVAAPPVPIAPKDMVRQPAELDRENAAHPGKGMTGLGRILTQYVAEPILDHPLLTGGLVAAQGIPVVGPAIDYAMMGMMGKDILEYSAQKGAELSFDQRTRQALEQDPERVKGEQAAVDAAMLALPAIGLAGAKRLTKEAQLGAETRLQLEAAGLTPEARDAQEAAAGTDRKFTVTDQTVADYATEQGINSSEARDRLAAAGYEVPGANGGDYLKGWDEQTLGPKPTREDYEAWKTKAMDSFLDRARAKQAEVAADGPRPDPARTDDLSLATRFHLDQVKDAWLNIFAPATRSPEALQTANIFRANLGEQAAQYEHAAFKLDEFRRAIDPLPDTDKLGFIDAIEGGRSQPAPEFQAAADAIRATLDEHREMIRALGPGKLDHFITDYFPHIWEDADKAAEAFTEPARGPLEGGKAFLKEREIPTTLEGMRLGLKPVTLNPVDLTLLKLREMQKYLMAHRSLNEMHDADLVKFVRAGDEAPTGYQRIDDKIATVFGSKTGGVKLPEGAAKPGAIEAVPIRDAEGGLRQNLRRVSDEDLTAEWQRLAQANAEEEARHAAVQESGYRADYNELPTTEKLGHQGKEDLPDADGTVDPEKLAGDNKVVADYNKRAVIRMAREKAMRRLEKEMDMRPSMSGMKYGVDEFKRTGRLPEGMVKLKPEDVEVQGMRIMGEYYAPDAVARVVNNHLSPGLRGNALFDAYRGLGNALNQAQLGLSAFHLGFTSMDATVSRAALGLEYIASGKPIKGLGELLSAPAAPITNAMKGAKIRQAYLHPESATPDLVALANAGKEAGARYGMDSFYKNSAPERMIEALKEGNPGKAALLSIPAMLEFASKPIMEHVVPNQKWGIFGDLASKILAELPDDASLADRRAALAKAWDSVDNRMGQVVYDNLFWNRTFKDLSMASVRSVGWNLGTIRELGGGIKDLGELGKAGLRGEPLELSHRAAYVLALPLIVGMYGAAYQLLRTGEGPSELKDYFHPKTGELDPDGNPERVQLPSYMKDMFAYAGHPWDTMKHKVSPAAATVFEMLENQDFYGDQIRNPDDPLVQQVQQEASYVAKQTLPFAIRNLMETGARSDRSLATKAENFVGITPAPRADVRSDAQNLMAKYLSERRTMGATPEDAAARQSRSELLGALRDNAGGERSDQIEEAVSKAIERHQLAPKDVVSLLKRAGSTPAQERFKRLTVAQALDVFKASTPREKALFAQLLLSKVDHAIAAGQPLPPGAATPSRTAMTVPPR